MHQAGDTEQIQCPQRRAFCGRGRRRDKSYTELATGLLHLANRWLDECKMKEEVVERIATEQFLEKTPEEIQIWAKDHKPETCLDAGCLADKFQLTRGDAKVSQQLPIRRSSTFVSSLDTLPTLAPRPPSQK